MASIARVTRAGGKIRGKNPGRGRAPILEIVTTSPGRSPTVADQRRALEAAARRLAEVPRFDFDAWLSSFEFAHLPARDVERLQRIGRRVIAGGAKGAQRAQEDVEGQAERISRNTQIHAAAARLRTQEPELSARQIAERLGPRFRLSSSHVRTILTSAAPHN